MAEIKRQRSQYHQKWKGKRENNGLLDVLDVGILDCIKEQSGISIVGVKRCLWQRLMIPVPIMSVRYRIETLEKAGFITTERVRNERHCFLAPASTEKLRRDHHRIHRT